MLAGTPPAQGALWTVRADGTGDFVAIQPALDAAAAGDTVEVGPGVWLESLVREGDVVLRSRDGPDVTVLDGAGTNPLLRLDAGAGSEIEGLTFTRGLRNEGGAIRVGSGALTVRGCRFVENRAAERGGAILADAGVRLVAEDCLFRDNETPEVGTGASVGAGITSRFSASVEIRRCTFEGNLARRGGALALQNTAYARVDESVFRENLATEEGGAVRFVRSYFEVEGCTFVGNRCLAGNGGVFHARESDGLFRRNLHVENEAAGGGVGTLETSRLRFLNETVVACRAVAGSALRLRGVSEAFVRNGIFADLAGSPCVRCEPYAALWPECNLAWEIDPGGDLVPSGGDDCALEAGALALDPRFCGNGDYHLRTDSPAADVPGCGLLGALPPQCEPVLALRPVSWGRVKAAYR
jgi:predicted outer membrane repeat protein